MKISLKWVEQFTSIDIKKDELIRRIGSQLGAIESIEEWGDYYEPEIIVAEIVNADDHPNADKLGVYELKVAGDKVVTVCAGDKTLNHGDKVGYIPPGFKVPASIRDGQPFTIEERELRGVKSQGMMGSGAELLINENHQKVLKLDTDAAIGTPLIEAYDLDDTIVDVENKMFTHRPDLFGILGVARELAGIQGVQFSSPEWYREQVDFPDATAELKLDVDVKIPELCPRFSAITIANVKIHDSPLIMQSYLMRVGLRPINNVVDITNYGMYLTSQPTHAFDYDKVAKKSKAGASIVVRAPKAEEELSLLDGRTIQPQDGTAMVATDQELISVGGSMGGADTEVDENTTNIILEAASWDLYSIRRTSFAHGLFTDAVTRFNKGQSPRQTVTVLRMLLDLFHDNTDGQLASGHIDEFPIPDEPRLIEVDTDFINIRLGSSFEAHEIAGLLGNVELATEVVEQTIKVTVPFWRMDLEYREDIVEEVGRLYGYDNLPVKVPQRRSEPNLRSEELQRKQLVRNILSSAGARDLLTYSFVPEDLLTKAGYDDALISNAYRIRNSLSPELEFMRLSLLPSIADKVNANIRYGHGSFALYEINKSHNKQEIEDGLPVEQTSLALVVASDHEQNGSPYYQAKAYLDYLSAKLGLEVRYRRGSDGDLSTPLGHSVKSMFSENRVAAVEVDDKFIGFIGEFSASAKNKFKLPAYSAGFEVDFNALTPHPKQYMQLSKFPNTTQDITLETPNEVDYADLKHLVEKTLTSDQYRLSMEPVGIYRPEPSARRRITFRLQFEPHERTLKTAEINQAIASLADKANDMGIIQI